MGEPSSVRLVKGTEAELILPSFLMNLKNL